MVSRHWLYFGGFVVTGILLVGATLMGIVDGLAVLTGSVPANEEFILLAMLGAAAEWVMIVLVLGLVALLFLAATGISVLHAASIPRDDRLVSIVELLERKYPVLRQFDVTEKVDPTTEDRQQQLREQYVSGEISEPEFEREMEQLMDDPTSEGQRPETTTEGDDTSY